jgi:hypothetical protein
MHDIPQRGVLDTALGPALVDCYESERASPLWTTGWQHPFYRRCPPRDACGCGGGKAAPGMPPERTVHPEIRACQVPNDRVIHRTATVGEISHHCDQKCPESTRRLDRDFSLCPAALGHTETVLSRLRRRIAKGTSVAEALAVIAPGVSEKCRLPRCPVNGEFPTTRRSLGLGQPIEVSAHRNRAHPNDRDLETMPKRDRRKLGQS